MDFGRAFSFPFEDPDWIRKIVITALISLIPFVGWMYLAGWMIEILRRVLRGTQPYLPEELDFGKYAMDGLKTLVISFVYSLPLIVFIVPPILVPILASAASDGSGGEGAMATLAVVSSCCCTGLAVLYGLFMAVILPAALANFAATDDLAAAFRFAEVFGLVRAAPGAYALVLAGALAVSALTSIGGAALIVGAFLVATYGQAVMAHLYAQAYTEARRNRGFAQAY